MNTTMPNTVLSTGGEWLEMGMREQATKKGERTQLFSVGWKCDSKCSGEEMKIGKHSPVKQTKLEN